MRDRKEYDKRYREKNKEKVKASRVLSGKKYREKNKENIKQRDKIYKEKTRYKRNARMKEDPLFKLKSNIRGLIRGSIKDKGWRKTTKTHSILGISFNGFMSYLNNNSYGFKVGDSDLDLDHIIPLCKAVNKEDIIQLNHYTNFQLLPSKYNRDIKRCHKWSKNDFEKWLLSYLE